MAWNGEELASMSKTEVDMGSIVSCPEYIAVRTERLESQLSDGAKSRRTEGSLSYEGCD